MLAKKPAQLHIIEIFLRYISTKILIQMYVSKGKDYLKLFASTFGIL